MAGRARVLRGPEREARLDIREARLTEPCGREAGPRVRRAMRVVTVLWLLTSTPDAVAGMCVANGTASAAFTASTARASARLLEATSQAFLAFAALDAGTAALEPYLGEARRLLDEATKAYREALALVDDVAKTDTFLRGREFDRLQATFGIAPGSLEHRRWQILTKTARESKAPTADVFQVCLAGAETLKTITVSLTRETQPALRRRSEARWHLILMHGGLVSDALDATVR